MAICEIETIPVLNKKVPMREYIRRDIQEALDKGIKTFEFVGEQYNYNTLSAVSREVAHQMFSTMVRNKFKEVANRKHPGEYLFPNFRSERQFYLIKQQKESDRIHVYMTIKLEDFESKIEEEVDDAWARHIRYEELKTQ